MKYEDIFAAISRRYDTFTRMEQNIADYVLEHGKDVLEMSISTLARECKVVESTIFRFCRTLGVSGYRDFRTALAVSLCAREQEQRTGRLADERSRLPSRSGTSTTAVSARCAKPTSCLQPGQLDEAVRRLMLADRVLVLGRGQIDGVDVRRLPPADARHAEGSVRVQRA